MVINYTAFLLTDNIPCLGLIFSCSCLELKQQPMPFYLVQQAYIYFASTYFVGLSFPIDLFAWLYNKD
jgi:hypothetical protein